MCVCMNACLCVKGEDLAEPMMDLKRIEWGSRGGVCLCVGCARVDLCMHIYWSECIYGFSVCVCVCVLVQIQILGTGCGLLGC